MGPFFVVQQAHKQGLLGGEHPTLIVNISSVLGSQGDETFSSKLPGAQRHWVMNVIMRSAAISRPFPAVRHSTAA